MRVCNACMHDFYEPLTFATLFNHPRYCPVCESLITAAFGESVVPTAQGQCHIITAHHNTHPALFHKIMHQIQRGGPIVFYDAIEAPSVTVFRLLSALIKPLRIYSPGTLDLDAIALIEQA